MPTKIEKDTVTGHGYHRPRVGRPEGTEHPAAEMVAVCASTPPSPGPLVWCVLYPSVPGITGYFHGVLGYSQRDRSR